MTLPFWFKGDLPNLFIGISLGLIINSLVMAWSLKRKHLTKWASITAFLMGFTTWIIEPSLFIGLVLFFFSSSLLTKFKNAKKARALELASKGGERDTLQVLANGSVVWVVAIFYFIVSFLAPYYTIAFLFAAFSALAASIADTWATEIGTLSREAPRSILDLRKKVEPGTSGGITRLGTIAAILGSSAIVTVGYIIARFTGSAMAFSNVVFLSIIIGIAFGIGGCFLDSGLGATIQGFYKCHVCGKNTEKTVHCNEKTMLLRGKKWFGNDLVNFLSTIFAGVGTFAAIIVLYGIPLKYCYNSNNCCR